MKILVNDYGGFGGLPSGQELPSDAQVDFCTDNGDRFRVTLHDYGLTVHLARKGGSDQMQIEPKMWNTINIK